MADPRKEPEGVITGVHRLDVVKRLERLSPTPSKPPSDQPGSVLDYMMALAQMHRSDAAYAAARAEEAAVEVKEELDGLKAQVLVLDGKLIRLDDRVTMVANAQIVQGSQITALDGKLIKLKEITESALTGMAGRISKVESRVDTIERTFQQFREMVLEDIAVRRRQLALDEVKNGIAPETPRADNDPVDASGPTTVRPKRG